MAENITQTKDKEMRALHTLPTLCNYGKNYFAFRQQYTTCLSILSLKGNFFSSLDSSQSLILTRTSLKSPLSL